MTSLKEKNDLYKDLSNLSLILGNRQSGNTTLMRMGTDNYDRDFLLVAHNRKYGTEITKNKRAIIKTGRDLEKNERNLPVAIDHHVLYLKLSEAVNFLGSSFFLWSFGTALSTNCLFGGCGNNPNTLNNQETRSEGCAPTANQYFILSVLIEISFTSSLNGIGLYVPN